MSNHNNNTPLSPGDYPIIYESLGYQITGTVITPEHNPGDIAEELLYTPMCYFKRNQGVFDLYVSVVVNFSETITGTSIAPQGASYWLTLVVGPDGSNSTVTLKKVVYLRFYNIPIPEGFKIPSLSVFVEGPPTGEGGAKSTTVDYEDAD